MRKKGFPSIPVVITITVDNTRKLTTSTDAFMYILKENDFRLRERDLEMTLSAFQDQGLRCIFLWSMAAQLHRVPGECHRASWLICMLHSHDVLFIVF